jgi:hypothetical protein
MKKEEEVENLEEEVVTLRVKIDKLNKKVEETKTSTSVVENEEKHSMLLEKKNEENRKSYEEVLKGKNHGQPESKKTIEDTYSRIQSMFKPQKSFNHDHDQSKKKFRRTTPQRRSFTPRYENLFYGHFFYCTNFGHKVADCRDYKRNVQADRAYVAACNIECYKCHNYGYDAERTTQARPLSQDLLPSRPKNFKVLLFPYREICTHNNLSPEVSPLPPGDQLNLAISRVCDSNPLRLLLSSLAIPELAI